jgi:hypothetical protein
MIRQKLDGAPIFFEERMLGKEFLLGEAMVARFGNLEAVFKKVNREREHSRRPGKSLWDWEVRN